jgi:uncharacterized protein YbjT (DUF2867 family)
MKVALTGATGFVGSHILAELQASGHEVSALVRDDGQADAIAARGATPVVADLYDRPALAGLLSSADGGHPYRQSGRRHQRRPGLGRGRRGD